MPAIAAPSAAKRLDPEALVAAVAQYEAAVRSQALLHNEESDSRLDDASRGLRRQEQSFASQAAGTVALATLRAVRDRLATYRIHGDEMSRIADARQDTLAEISNHFDSLGAHLQSAVGREWKILGRVIARKSLIDLKFVKRCRRAHTISRSRRAKRGCRRCRAKLPSCLICRQR
jgi:hypothetical protein